MLGLLLVGCSGTYAVPDQSASESQDGVAEIAAVLEGSEEYIDSDARCQVTYLGEHEGWQPGWVQCAGLRGLVSGPVRATSQRAEWPRDATCAEDVRAMFPRELADAILHRPSTLHGST